MQQPAGLQIKCRRLDACEKVIYMNTFSKSLTPTIRISYMILPVHLANQFYRQLSFYSCTVSNFEQYTLAAFINQGYFEKHINRMRLFYSRQRKKLIEAIEHSSLKEKCRSIENDSGLHFLLHLQTELSDQCLSEQLKQQGIKMLPLSEYFLTAENSREHYFIINYSCVDLEKIPAACERIHQLLSEKNA